MKRQKCDGEKMSDADTFFAVKNIGATTTAAADSVVIRLVKTTISAANLFLRFITAITTVSAEFNKMHSIKYFC